MLHRRAQELATKSLATGTNGAQMLAILHPPPPSRPPFPWFSLSLAVTRRSLSSPPKSRKNYDLSEIKNKKISNGETLSQKTLNRGERNERQRETLRRQQPVRGPKKQTIPKREHATKNCTYVFELFPFWGPRAGCCWQVSLVVSRSVFLFKLTVFPYVDWGARKVPSQDGWRPGCKRAWVPYWGLFAPY